MMPPIVLHVPHASTVIPSRVRSSLLLSDDELRQEILSLTDHYTDELFAIPGTAMVRFPVSRLVLDPERFEDDKQEVMAKIGMGVIYTRTSNGQILRGAFSTEEHADLLCRYYRPHHCALTRVVKDKLAQHGRCLIVDCHSFPSKPLPYELEQNPECPDICIGTDPFHTPDMLRNAVVSGFKAEGFSVAVNRPFSGALVPSCYYRADEHIMSIMIEINRRLYVNEHTGEKLEQFDQIRDMLARVIVDLAGKIGAAEG